MLSNPIMLSHKPESSYRPTDECGRTTYPFNPDRCLNRLTQLISTPSSSEILKLCLNSLRQFGYLRYCPQVTICSHLIHDDRIRQLLERNAQFLSHVFFRLPNFHSARHLHASHQISGSPHSAHARGNRVSHSDPDRISCTHLQTIESTDFNQRFGRSRRGIVRTMDYHRRGPHPHAEVRMNGHRGIFNTGFYKGGCP